MKRGGKGLKRCVPPQKPPGPGCARLLGGQRSGTGPRSRLRCAPLPPPAAAPALSAAPRPGRWNPPPRRAPPPARPVPSRLRAASCRRPLAADGGSPLFTGQEAAARPACAGGADTGVQAVLQQESPAGQGFRSQRGWRGVACVRPAAPGQIPWR